MAKGKTKKNKKNKAKKAGNVSSITGKTAKRLKDVTRNPLAADIVAAALVGMAAALKDSNKARKMAMDAGDEITKLSRAGAKKGSALWDMALQIGRESLEALSSDGAPKRAKSKPAASAKRPKKASAKAKTR